MRTLLLAVAAFLACVLLVPRGRVIAIERPVVVEQYGPWFPPTITLHGTTVAYVGLESQVDPVELDSLTYDIDWLRQALENDRERELATPAASARSEHVAACIAQRDTWPGMHMLCPGRAVIVELAGEHDAAIVNRVLYTVWHAGYEPVIRYAESAGW